MCCKTACTVLAAAILLATAPALADPEECNGIDDDDDGLTDEELVGPVCSYSQTDDPDEGICDPGEMVCVDAEWVCNANEPMPEICDALDNDCDGLTDVDLEVECPSGVVCIMGECFDLCQGDDFWCPEGFVCEEVDGEFVCIPDVCTETSDDPLPCLDNPFCCSEGFTPPCHCETLPQLCVDLCYGVTCPDGYVCVPEDGGCCRPVGESCYVDGCLMDDICVDGECVADPCAVVWCEEELYCNADGNCVEPCVVDCPDGCFENECVEDPCAGVMCEPGWSCEGGACVQGDCWGVVCEFYEVCVDGECLDDPCWNIDCPDCFVCLDGGCYEWPPDWGSDADTDVDSDSDSDSDTDTATDTADDDDGTPSDSISVVETRCRCTAVGAARSGSLLDLFRRLL